MDNGYPSIFHARLSHGLKPTTMLISKQFDPLSRLIHQPDLICNPDWFPGERRVGFKGEDGCKILNLTNDQSCQILLGAQRLSDGPSTGEALVECQQTMRPSGWREVQRGFMLRCCSTAMYIPFSQLTSSGHQDLSKSESPFKWSKAPGSPALAEQLLPTGDYYFSRG